MMQGSSEREVITLLKFKSDACSIYLQKQLIIDSSDLESSMAELDDDSRFNIRGADQSQSVIIEQD